MIPQKVGVRSTLYNIAKCSMKGCYYYFYYYYCLDLIKLHLFLLEFHGSEIAVRSDGYICFKS